MVNLIHLIFLLKFFTIFLIVITGLWRFFIEFVIALQQADPTTKPSDSLKEAMVFFIAVPDPIK